MGNDYPPIRTFSDALAEAWAMEHRFRRAHSAVLLDRDGHIWDMTAFTRADHTIDTALEWAMCMVHNYEEIVRMILISVVKDPTTPREDDIAIFNRAREIFGGLCVDVVDWLQVNRDDARSLAFTTGIASWEGDAVADALRSAGEDDPSARAQERQRRRPPRRGSR